MANFRTHISVAAITSCVLATTSLYAGLMTTQQTLPLWGLGVIGGLLPDIDSDNSTSLGIIHSLLAVILATCLSGYLVTRLPLGLNLLVITGAVVSQHFIALPLLRKLTVHRGNCHSLLAGVTCALITTNISIHLLNNSPQTSYLAGLFLATGYLVHLLLDEIFAINFSGARLKKSFGTAIKPFATGTPVTTGLLAFSCLTLVIQLPELRSLKIVVLQLLSTSRNALGYS